MSKIQVITALPRALIDAGYNTPKYRDIYDAAISARIPVMQGSNGRWTFRLDDVSTIASTLALSKRQQS